MGYPHAAPRTSATRRSAQTVARFYRDFKGQRATFRDFQRVAEAVSGKPLGWIFDDLITRAGAPVLGVKAGPGGRPAGRRAVRRRRRAAPDAGRRAVRGRRARRRADRARRHDRDGAPGEGRAAVLDRHRQPRRSRCRSIRDFDVFRRLDPRETPPSIGQIFGEPSILAVLPSDAGAAELDAYRALLKGWQSDAHAITVDARHRADGPAGRPRRVDHRPHEPAGGRAVRRASRAARRRAPASRSTARRCRSRATRWWPTFRHPANVEKAVGWIVADPAAALPGLGRKLPHYGKYSYLGLRGRRAGQHHQGPVAAVRLAAARRPAARGRARRQARAAARRTAAQGARGAAAGVLAAGAAATTSRSSPHPI